MVSDDPQHAEQRDRPARSRHTGRRRWVTYIGYALLSVGLACLAVHLFSGWRLVEVHPMLPTYLWIVTVVLIVVGPVMVLANEGLRRLEGSGQVVFGQVVSEADDTERPEQGTG